MRQGGEYLFAQAVVDLLGKAFPGWVWTACVDGNVLYIKCPLLSERFGMRKDVDKVDRHWVIMAGGEMLERFGMPYTYDPKALDECRRDASGAPESDKWTPDRRHWNKSVNDWRL
jgi:hypothetical protein